MAYQTLLYGKENGIGIITINRPQVMNALNDLAYAELLQLFQEIERDAEVRVVIITGAGETWITDLSDDELKELFTLKS